MNFTVVFDTKDEEMNLAYSLQFIPCPIWKHGAREVVNLHPDYPNYKRGDLATLLVREGITKRLTPERQAAIMVHGLGNGVQSDLQALQEELWAERFKVSVLFFGCAALG